MNYKLLKYDCKNFKGDRPCFFNKKDGTVCDNCNNYSPIKKKILIVKLDAIGDVLRTTSILKPLRDKYTDHFITWLTKENAKDLFIGNPYVDEVLTTNEETFFRLMCEQFDIVINLDNSKVSSAIASSVKGHEKIGFTLDPKGYVIPSNEAADYWLHLSAFDNLKKSNTRTYQEIIYSILNLNEPISSPILNITGNNTDANKYISDIINLSTQNQIIGLNIGIGPKWPSKGWPLVKWEELIEKLLKDKIKVLLLVGPDEIEANKYLLTKFPGLNSSGCHNTLIKFAEIMNLCSVIVTSDSLALHIATALNKKTIVLFGPTSANEIELYNNGIKLKADDECKCFYNKYCSEPVSCMEKISVEKVYNSILNLIEGKF